MKTAQELAEITREARDAAAKTKKEEAEKYATEFVNQMLLPEAQNGYTQMALPAGVTFDEGVKEALKAAGFQIFSNRYHVTFVAW